MFEKKLTDEEKKLLTKESRRKEKMNKEINGKIPSKVAEMAKMVVIPLLLAAVMVCFLYIVVRNNVIADNLKKDVVVATKDIPHNTKIEEKDITKYFKVISVDYKVATDVNYKDISDLPKGSFYVTEELKKGQLVYKDDIEASDFVMDKYDENSVVTSLKVSDFSNSICGALRYGDIVDVYATDPATDELIFVLGDIYVLGAYSSSGELLEGEEGSATAFTVMVTPEEIELLNKAIAWGNIQLYKK